LNALHDDWLLPVAQVLTVAPSGWPQALADVATAVAEARGVQAPAAGTATPVAQAIARSLLSGQRRALLLGNTAAQHPQASTLLALAQWIGQQADAAVGYLGEAANTVGAQLVNALPGPGGLNAGQMLSQPMKAQLLLNIEPTLDAANAAAAKQALAGSGLVVALTSFKDAGVDNADVLLPIAPFTETAGTFVNAEGRAQGFHGVARPLGETRPAWKVIRVLGNLMGLPGFDQDSAEQVRDEALGSEPLATRLDNASTAPFVIPPVTGQTERVADVPIYSTDMLVRRSAPLQLTADARPPVVGLPPTLWHQLGLQPGAQVRVTQGQGAVVLPAREDATLAEGTVRVSAGHASTTALGAMFGPITVERA
jgi:NADH-quinone oxidoreductase subunit G